MANSVITVLFDFEDKTFLRAGEWVSATSFLNNPPTSTEDAAVPAATRTVGRTNPSGYFVCESGRLLLITYDALGREIRTDCGPCPAFAVTTAEAV